MESIITRVVDCSRTMESITTRVVECSGPGEERGVFRSRDGGATWEKVLYVNDKTGCADLALDPTNPRASEFPAANGCRDP